jgi:IclR family acetate operon transcriptional repressor
MQELRDKTGETVHLTMEISGEGVYVEKVESYSSVRLSTRLGTRAPLHAGASFKVLLAHLPRNRVEEVIKQGLPKLTEHTIANATALKNELEKIRKQGYAISHGELYDGFTAIAAPIRDSENQVIAGISVIAPSAKYASERVKEMISWVRETANHVSVSMGWNGRGEGRNEEG